ncbi:MAG: C-terminal binding protein [Conexibacter sp.]
MTAGRTCPVLLTDTTYREHALEREILGAAGASLLVADPPLHDEAALLAYPELGSVRALMVELAPITAAVLDAAPQCRIVARSGVGLDNIDLAAAAARSVWVTNVPGYATDTVADHAVALLLAAARDLAGATARVRTGGWRDVELMSTPLLLRDRILGVVGFGAIGQAVAIRGQSFGLRVVAHDPGVPEETYARLGVERLSLADLLAQSDVVSLHTALTDDTRSLLDAESIQAMKRGAIVVNTARGGLIDEDALIAALDSGQLACAALDVFAQEPLDPNHPLRTHPRAIVTPHVAFWSDGSELILRRSAAEAVVAVLQDREPDGTVVAGRAIAHVSTP